MIPLFLLTIGWGLVSLPGVVREPTRLHARDWARAGAAALVTGILTIQAALIILALPTVLRAVNASGLASICDHLMPAGTPGGTLIGWVSFGLAVTVGTQALRTIRKWNAHARGAVIEPWLGRHERRGSYELVMLPTTELLAVSIPKGGGQLVISEGLVDELSPDELELVLRHEEAHLQCKHWRFVLLAAMAEKSLRHVPMVLGSVGALRQALESWADEVAAGDSPARRATAERAMFAVACRGGVPTLRQEPAWRLGARVRRLEAPAVDGFVAAKAAMFAPIASLMTAAVLLLADWLASAPHAVAMVASCVK